MRTIRYGPGSMLVSARPSFGPAFELALDLCLGHEVAQKSCGYLGETRRQPPERQEGEIQQRDLRSKKGARLLC